MEDYHNQLKVMVIECFWLRYPELKPGVEYKAKEIFEPFWAGLEPWQQRIAGDIFFRLVDESDGFPMECLGESKRTGHSLIYRRA